MSDSLHIVDEDQDSVTVRGWRTGVLLDAKDADDGQRANVSLSRADALNLYHWLGQWLVAVDHIDAEAHPMHSLPDATADGYDWPEQPESIALEAHNAVYGDRQADYGHPREDFTRTAILWTGLLQHKLADGEYVEAGDIGRCMIAVKLSRDVNSPKRDNRVDMAGYALTLDRLETGR